MHPTNHQPPHTVCTDADALLVIWAAMQEPPVHETLAFLLDDQGRGGVVLAVTGTHRPDAVLDVVDNLGKSTAGFGYDRAQNGWW